MKSAILIIFVMIAGVCFEAIAGKDYPQTAADCKTVNLRKEFGQVRSQHGSNWCYAATAADLLSFKFRSELQHQQLPMAQIAMFHARRNVVSFLTTGSSKAAIQEAMLNRGLKGLCKTEDIDQLLLDDKSFSATQKFNYLADLKKDYDRRDHHVVSQKIKKLLEVISHKVNFTEQDILSVLKETKKAKDFPITLTQHLCAKDNWIPSEKVKVVEIIPADYYEFKSNQEKNRSLNRLNRELDKDNPVGLYYNVSILGWKDGHYFGPHISTVIGRQWNVGKRQCEYLIRNSWGDSCDPAYTNQRGEKVLGGYREDLLDSCNEGHLWLSAEDVYDSFFGITYIEK